MSRPTVRADGSKRTTNRRRVLAASAGLGAALAGCLGRGESGSSSGSSDSGEGSNGSGGGGVPADALSAPVKGNPDAGTTVAVFEDFACPHCREYVLDVLPRIERKYTDPGRIRYEHHDFPIPVDPQVSWQAASAARAVQDRAGDEAFFTYATRLYENQDSLDPDEYESLTEGIDVDGGFVRTAATDERYRKVVAADRSAGEKRGLSGTPAVFIDDQSESVTPSFEAISTAIESAR